MRAIWMAAGLSLTAFANAAAGQESVPARVMGSPPKIDGTIGEQEWIEAATFEGLVEQDTGAPAEEGGQFWLASDDQFVYFAARLVDHQPSQIQATEYRTNVGLRGNDSVTIEIDPFGHLSDFSRFSMNPRGATSIWIAGGRAPKREWLGDFAAQGRITKDGWEVEARIPWSVMRLPAAGKHDLRFNVYRDFRRKQRGYAWGFTTGGRIDNFGRWLGVRIPPTPPRTLKALPYVYAGYDDRENGVANAGVDFRTELTERLDLVGAVNPDFRNIENQVLSLDFSYFERLANEARPFFLEGGQYFRTSYDSPIFASQRVGSFDAGLKTFGKLDDQTDLGLLDTIDFGNENSLVAKVRRQLSEASAVEAAYVGYSSLGPRNDAGFVNAWRNFGPYNTYLQHASTADTELGRGDRTNGGFGYRKDGMRWGLDFLRITPNYYPRLGYAPEVDVLGFGTSFGMLRRTDRGGLMEHEYGVSAVRQTRNDGSPYREGIGANASMTWKDGFDLDLYANATNFYPYRDRTVGIGIERPRGDSYRRWSVDYAFGELAGQRYFNQSYSLAYRPMTRLQLGASYQAVDVTGEHYDQAIVSASYDLDPFQSVSGRLVASNGNANGYVAFRRAGNRGAEYFLILGDPNAERFRFSAILKAVFPVEFGLGGRAHGERHELK